MRFRRAWAIWAGAVVAAAVVATTLVLRQRPTEVLSLVTGAVLANDSDLHKQRPIAQARVSASAGVSEGTAVSDESGLFRLTLDPPISPEQPMTLTVQHPDYLPFEASDLLAGQLMLLRMTPREIETKSTAGKPEVAIANVRVRYAYTATTSQEVASAARTFDIVNTPNTPCNKTPPCSPDGRWKATVETFSLTAGPDRAFRNARVSCLAGPCPFTRVASDAFSAGGQVIRGSVLNWGDTVTYLVEAEVSQTMTSDLVRHSYPVIFDRSMNFTLPRAAQGPSIEAEVNGEAIIFPLGPQLRLSWATCRLDTAAGRTDTGGDSARLYRCELKPGYLFKPERASSMSPDGSS
jgi:hypothetical protein